MHFHAEHQLFFGRRKPLWHTVSCLALTVFILILNASTNITISLMGAGLGSLLLLVSYVRGHNRIEPVLAWAVALITVTMLGGTLLSLEIDTFIDVATRISCGIIWILWLGTQIDWVSLRQLFIFLRVPENIVSTLDHAIMHGVLTKKEWSRRRDAARLRLGGSRLPLSAWGQILSEGALQAFFRLEFVEKNAILRSSRSQELLMSQKISLDKINVKRGDNLVLENINLCMAPGEWVLLCGPSGAGKSSLLRLLAGLDEPTQGKMTRLGLSISSDSSLDLRLDGRIALLVQNPEHHFIASTVAEDIMWGMLQRGLDINEAQQRCTEISKSLRIEHLLERPCYELSYGEQRRVALAGLLVLDPALLLLDEPTSGLDPVTAYELSVLIEKTVQRTGATCIWATHDLNSIPPQAKRVILLRNGHVLYDGDTSEGLSNQWLIRARLAVPQQGEKSC